MTSLTMPLISVQVAFANNPYDASLTWTDITPYVETVSTTAGRQHELQQTSPSTATLVLTNQDGRFSSWNTGSPYYHSGTGIAPGHPIRIQATWPRTGGTTYPVFYGYCKSWTPGYGATQAKMTLQAYDVLALLNLNTLDTGQYAVLPMAHAHNYWPLGDPAGSSTAVDVVGGNTASFFSGVVRFGQPGPLLTETTTAVFAQGILGIGNSISGTTYSVDGWIKTTALTGPIIFDIGVAAVVLRLETNGVAVFGQAATQAFGTTNLADGLWHYLAGTYDGTAFRLYVDGELVDTVPFSGTLAAGTGFIVDTDAFDVGATYAQIAAYNITLTPEQIASQYQLGTATWLVQDSGARVAAVLAVSGIPSALMNIPAGTAQCQGATSALNTTTAMSYLNTVINTERGFLYQDNTGVVQYRNRHYVYENAASINSQATFGYAGGQFHYFSSGFTPTEDDVDLWNNVPVQRTSGTVQDASDATSITKYGRRTLTGYTNLLFANDTDSQDLAGGLLYQYKNSQTRVRAIAMDSTISAGANLPQMLGRGLLDRITINWRPLDGSGVDFSQQSLIEGISHTITPDTWTTAWAVTPIGTENFANYGTDVYGTGIYGF